MRCERCDAQLDAGALGGLCPVCLLDAALPDDDAGAANGAFGYDLIEEIGRGGMGVVYRAVQHGSQRQVAVKMILAEQAATPGAMERFRSEVEAVASLDHPHILPVYEAGDADGMPFYSLKFATGGTLRERIADFRGKPREAARMIATIARAVHHAHQRGILHRDLKPGNILLDGPEQTPYVADFGLAKWLGRDNRLTIASTALGTPHYMAPEQAAGESAELTTAADIYSLGAILYELLAQRPPFVADTPLETLRLVASAAPPSPRSFEPSVPRDLEVIAVKCLAKEPLQRYTSAAALAEDLERWLEGRTIRARPSTALERTWRWTKRNPATGTLAAACVVLVLAAAIGATAAAVRIAAARDRAVAAEQEATERLHGSYVDQARASRLAGRRFDALAALEKAAGIRKTPAVRDETIAALALVDFRRGASWPRPPSLSYNVGFDCTLERYVTEDGLGELSVRRVADHHELVRLRGPDVPLGYVHGFSRDGRFLAAKFTDGVARIWDLRSARQIFQLWQSDWTSGEISFSPDSRVVMISLPEDGVAFYRLDDLVGDGEIDPARPWRKPDAPGLWHHAAFDPTGERIALVDVGDAAKSNGREGVFQVREVETGRVIFEVRSAAGYSVVDWSPDGKLVAVGSWDHQIYLHDAETGAVRRVLRGHLGALTNVRFSHSGAWLATTSFDYELRLWDVQSGLLVSKTTEASFVVPRFSRDDRRLSTSFDDGTAGWLEIAPAEVFRTFHPARDLNRPWSLAASADGRLLASSGDGGAQVWEVKSGRGIEAPLEKVGHRTAVAFTRDSASLLASSRADGMHRWRLDWNGEGARLIGDNQPLRLPIEKQCLLTDMSHDGREMFVSYLDQDFVSAVALDGGGQRRDFRGHPHAYQVAASPDGKWVASGARTNGGVRVWNAASTELAAELESGETALVAFSPGSEWLLSATAKGYQFWRSGSWEKGPRIEAMNGAKLQSFSAAFSPSGDLLAVQQGADRIALHDARDGTPLATLESPRPLVTEVLRFTGDGNELAALGANQVIQLWDVRVIRRELRARGLDWPEHR